MMGAMYGGGLTAGNFGVTIRRWNVPIVYLPATQGNKKAISIISDCNTCCTVLSAALSVSRDVFYCGVRLGLLRCVWWCGRAMCYYYSAWEGLNPSRTRLSLLSMFTLHNKRLLSGSQQVVDLGIPIHVVCGVLWYGLRSVRTTHRRGTCLPNAG